MQEISKAIVDGSLEAISGQDKLEGINIARRNAVKKQYGKKAQVVEPYKPNRKQRRAQAAAERAVAKEKK